jgi:hypothetical protein
VTIRLMTLRPATIRPVLRAEWTKFRTVRGWVIGLIVAAALMAGLGLFVAGSNNSECSDGPTAPILTGRACLPQVPLGPGGQAVTDSFYFVRQPLAGDGSITVRVTSLTGSHPGAGVARAGAAPGPSTAAGLLPWSKAGIIMTASTRPGSAYAAMMVTGRHGVRLQDDYVHDTAGLPGQVSAASPRWLRLTRAGDTITGYDSAGGTRWTRVSTVTVPGLPATIQAGLFVTSPVFFVTTASFGGGSTQAGPSQATGVFDHVRLSSQLSGRPAGGWAGDAVGSRNGHGEGYTERSGRFTVSGSGDIAPDITGPGSVLSTTTIENPLVAGFLALIVLVVIAGMFMTAEYRRGLIRATLAASPRRGQVLAAKAIVIFAVAFAVGLIASAIVVPLGRRLSLDSGAYVLPVGFATELRVVTGAALALAVSAVLALGLATLVRRSAATITAAIVVIALPYFLSVGGLLPQGAAEWLLRFTPAAGFAIEQSIPVYPQVTGSYSPGAGYFPLAPWAGFAVLCGYAALILGLAAWLLRRRDA